MRKKIILRLLLLTAFMALLWSCRSEDLLHEENPSGSSSSLSSAKYASRSLWKEDGVYINKVQQVFLKIANMEHVRARYGELNWDYAMSFGNFNETYALVPIIKDNKVVLLMEAVRTGNRVFLYEKDNKDLIEFFNLALYSNVIKYDEAINAKANAVSKISAFVCTTRWLSIGCFDNEPNCVPYVKAVTNCEFQGGDGGIPPKTFDPIGMDGGGDGNNGYEYPDPPEEEIPNKDIIDSLKSYPCAQALVKQLPTLKNDIATAMNGIFNNNENYDIIFRAKSGLGEVDGTTHSSYSSEFGTFKAIINLNDNVLTNATKEYILVTMYHEVVHAYLDYEKFRLGNEAFEEQYPSVIVGYDYAADGTMVNRFTFIDGHQQLGAFLTTLQNILSAYNPNLPPETVKAIAKAGITTMTTAEIELNKNERDTSLGKQKGTKCP